jgi:hypothetical protein
MRRVFILLLLVGLFGCESPGRYQLVATGADSERATATYLVDTQTGRVWKEDSLNTYYQAKFDLLDSRPLKEDQQYIPGKK